MVTDTTLSYDFTGWETAKEEGIVKYYLYPDAASVQGAGGLAKLCNQLLAEVQLHNETYFWERESFSLTCSNEPVLVLKGQVRLGDGLEDEWFVTFLLKQLTLNHPGLIAIVEDEDGQFILIEAAEHLPEWLEPETSLHRVFLMNGQLHIISPIMLPQTTLSKSLTWLRAHTNDALAAGPIRQVLEERINPFATGHGKSLHRARVLLPRRIANLLNIQPTLITCMLDLLVMSQPFPIRQACSLKTILKMDGALDLFPIQATFTRHQFAALLGYSIETPTGFPLPEESSPSYLASRLGLLLTLAFELAFLPEAPSPNPILAALQKDYSSYTMAPYQGPDDDTNWLNGGGEEEEEEEKRQNYLVQSIEEKLKKAQLNELELETISNVMLQETLNPSKYPNQADELMRKFLQTKSSFEGVDIDNDGCEDDKTDSDDSNSEGEEFIHQEIYETILHDPDLLMKILDMSDGNDKSNDTIQFIKHLREQAKKLQSIPPTGNKAVQKGIADIDPVKLKNANYDRLDDPTKANTNQVLNVNDDDTTYQHDDTTSETSSDPGAEDVDEFVYTEDERPTGKHLSLDTSDWSDGKEPSLGQIMTAMDEELLQLAPDRASSSTSISNLEMAARASFGPALTILNSKVINKE